MAEPTTNLRVRISADLADIKSALSSLQKDLASVKRTSSGTFGNTNGFVTGLRRARAELVGFVGAYLSLRGAKVLAGIADEATQLRGRIREAKGDYEAILALAQRSRTGLTATVDLYARLERSTRNQRLNQQALLGLTESVNQAVKLSYASAVSADAALIQLGQGLGAGQLRGEELNSVMEQTPRLAQAIADGLGVPIGKLRELAKEGELTTAAVTKALKSQATVLAAEYARVPVTISDALTQVRNALVDYIGDQDAATGASRRFAKTLQEVARDLPRYLDPLLKSIQLLLENLDTLIVYLGVRLAGGAIAAAVLGFGKLIAIITAAKSATITLRVALLALGGPVGIAIAALAAGVYYLYKRTNEARVAAESHRKALSENAAMARSSAQAAMADAKAKRAQAIETLSAARAVLAEKSARLGTANTRAALIVGEGRSNQAGRQAAVARGQAAQAQRQVDQAQQQLDDWTRAMIRLQLEIQQTEISSAAGADAATSSLEETADKAKKAVKGVIDQAELIQDAVGREMEALDRQFEVNAISIIDYYGRKKALQEADLDAQIAQAQAEARTATTSEQQSKALTEIIKLQRQRADIGPAVAREQAKAEEELAKKLGEVKLRLLEAEGQTARARTAQLEEEFRDLIIRLQAEGDAAGVALVRKLINVEAADAQLDQFDQLARDVIQRLQSAETSFASQAEAGMLGTVEAERMLARERDSALIQLRDLRARVLAYLATLDPNSPEFKKALEGLRQLDGNIAQIEVAQDRLKQKFEDTLADSLTNLFTDIATGAKSAKEAFKDFVRSFLEGVARIIAQELALRAAKAIIGAISGRAHHRGGVVGSSGTVRHGLNPLLFGNAPRYHSGGFAGLRPNEVPAVLERGEEVITRKDPRHRLNGGRVAAGGIAINTNVSVEGGSNASEQDARALGSLVTAKVKEVMTQESRQGGILWRMQNA